ncbi:hypothetical protein F0562_024188 [Nyssa sinensis]|uniref:Gamma-tubulin complex component n=1 Tax=Nyssa sinensis TaxID=561372 RepID=A0A5J5BBZ7_9ASTE|nr:hypothetical protein F0562_024188 [Nyssa sinensis]
MAKEDILGDNQIEDVRWLCSLSESELDMLISLKKMIIRRANIIGHDALVKKFDLKMLRALGFILMEYLNGQIKDMADIPGLAESSAILDGCNLLKRNLDTSFDTMDIEELRAYVGADKKKRIAELFCEDATPKRKKKTNFGRSL